MAHSTPPSNPWTHPALPNHSVYSAPIPMFEALAAGDISLANSLKPSGFPALTPFLVSTQNQSHWRRRLDLLVTDREQEPWMSRLLVYSKPSEPLESEAGSLEVSRTSTPIVVGRVGFHGKPDARGMVEVGYEIDPTERRKGHGKAALRIMVHIAREVEGAKILRACVMPEVWISRRIVQNEGLKYIGQKVDARRGLGDVFEMDVSS